MITAATTYLAHGGAFGVDEALVVAVPMAVIIGLIMIIGMRHRGDADDEVPDDCAVAGLGPSDLGSQVGLSPGAAGAASDP